MKLLSHCKSAIKVERSRLLIARRWSESSRFHFEMGSDVDSSGPWTDDGKPSVDSALDCARENSDEGFS